MSDGRPRMQPLETSIDSAAGVAGAAPARAEPGQAAQALETSAPAPARQPRSKVLASPGHARHAPSSSRPGRAAAATPKCQMHPARPATRLGAQLPTARAGCRAARAGAARARPRRSHPRSRGGARPRPTPWWPARRASAPAATPRRPSPKSRTCLGRCARPAGPLGRARVATGGLVTGAGPRRR